MKNKNGFTLIELLAVIVVLAVIMVIATQQVNGVMAKARSNSFIESYQMVIRQGKTCAAQDTDASDQDECNYDLTDDYQLTVTASGDVYTVTLTATNSGKFANMDLTQYGNAANDNKDGCDATKIGAGASSCTKNSITGTFKK